MIKFEPREGYERLAFGEVLVPDTPNVYGDFHTKESVRQFAYGFMINGFGIDKNHDHSDQTGGVRIIESFLAQPDDPRGFTEGSWVVGIYVLDDQLWDDILTGEINGYSYEALVSSLGVIAEVESIREVYGETFPGVDDGHTHKFWVRLDVNGRVIAGGTLPDSTGHEHVIAKTTYTNFDDAETHRHRFDILKSIEVMNEQAAA